MSKKIIRHEIVEIIIPANSTLTKFMFPDLPNLRNVHLFGLQVYHVDQLGKSPESQTVLLSKAHVLNESFLTLVDFAGNEFTKKIPSAVFNTIEADLSTSTNIAEKDFKSFIGQKLDYPKCYVEFFNGSVSEITDRVYLLSIYYSMPIAKEKKISATFNKGC